jgi:predicted metal-dependent TIM-barrel fold hydrolase
MATKRKKRPTDSSEYLAFMQRLARNMTKRVQDDGVDALHALGVIAKMHDEVMHELVAYLRSEEGGSHTWADIGEALGMTRQSAQGRFG